MKYKAILYLTSIPNGLGGESYPVLMTDESEDKEAVLRYVKKLVDNQIVKAYRVIYKMPTSENWYMSNEVEYLPAGPVFALS